MKAQTLSHYKFRRLHSLLGSASVAHTAGYLEVLWLHCQQVGNGPMLKRETVECVCDWPGEKGALVSSMVESGWLNEHESGAIVEIHDFADHAPAYVVKRDAKAEYMREYREKKAKQDGNVTPCNVSVIDRNQLQVARNQLQSSVTDPTYTILTHTIPSNTDLNPSNTCIQQDINITKTKRARATKPKTTLNEDAFAKFWEAYPNKQKMARAKEAFAKLNPDAELLDTILQAVEAQKKGAGWISDNGKYIPLPCNWLIDERWTDAPRPNLTKYGLEVKAEKPEDEILF